MRPPLQPRVSWMSRRSREGAAAEPPWGTMPSWPCPRRQVCSPHMVGRCSQSSPTEAVRNPPVMSHKVSPATHVCTRAIKLLPAAHVCRTVAACNSPHRWTTAEIR